MQNILKIFLFIVSNFFSASLINAQTVLLEQNLKSDTVKRVYGENLKHYFHAFIGFGCVVADPSRKGADLVYGLSNMGTIGVRYKHKISSFYAIGYNFGLSTNRYKIKQSQTKRLLNDSMHVEEKLIVTNLFFEFYNRINFGRRGNIIGKYFDLGIYGSWTPVTRLLVKDISQLQNKNVMVKKNIRKLNFIEPFSYGLSARLGINKYTLFASYRLISLFKTNSGMEDLPPLIIGFQISFY